jgi:hypothetical protein
MRAPAKEGGARERRKQQGNNVGASRPSFKLDGYETPNYIAGHGPIRDPIPTQFALTLFTLSGRPVAR